MIKPPAETRATGQLPTMIAAINVSVIQAMLSEHVRGVSAPLEWEGMSRRGHPIFHMSKS